VVPPEDPRAYTAAIAEAFADRARLAAVGERGRAFVAQEYSKQVVGLAYARLVDKILQPRAR
jgi:glycosyltransferase involved in cell wall biosynthesis